MECGRILDLHEWLPSLAPVYLIHIAEHPLQFIADTMPAVRHRALQLSLYETMRPNARAIRESNRADPLE